MRETKFEYIVKDANRGWCQETFKLLDIELGYAARWIVNNKFAFSPSFKTVKRQCTGLKDMEGTEVFEGDILTLNFGIPPTVATLVVEWSEEINNGEYADTVGWFLRSVTGGICSAGLSMTYEHDIRIIGNIHQNPELLNEKS